MNYTRKVEQITYFLIAKMFLNLSEKAQTKKFIAIILAATILILLVSCGAKKDVKDYLTENNIEVEETTYEETFDDYEEAPATLSNLKPTFTANDVERIITGKSLTEDSNIYGFILVEAKTKDSALTIYSYMVTMKTTLINYMQLIISFASAFNTENTSNGEMESAIETLNSIDVKIYKDKVVVFGTQDTLTLLDKYYK